MVSGASKKKITRACKEVFKYAFANTLSVDNLSCEIDGHALFTNQSFTLNSGEPLALRGANGSGKSCFLRCLCGTMARANASVLWDRQSITLTGLAKYCMRVGHKAPFLASLSLYENLQFWADILAANTNERVDNLQRAKVDFTLAPFWHAPMWRLSAGQRQRGALAMLALKPQASLWLLDEPHAALDSAARKQLTSYIKNHLSGGGMLIIASHEDLSAISQQSITLCYANS